MSPSRTRTRTALRRWQHPITHENLYQPDKYKVHVGRGSVGFCTAWNDPAAAIKAAPRLREKAALVGSLYSNQGVNVMVRNLALNPFIKRVYLWGHGSLSNTKFGLAGTSVLKKLWRRGIQKDRLVPGTAFKLDKKINLRVLKIMRQNIELKDVGNKELAEAAAAAQPTSLEPYMRPVRFPEAPPEKIDTFPSEQIGWLIRGRTVIDAWARVVERVMRYGLTKRTQYGSRQKELLGVTWVIHGEDPDRPQLPKEWPGTLREVTGATPAAISEYQQAFLSPGKPDGTAYTYGHRLMRYPRPGQRDGINQITQSIIANLRASPDTRRAVATTLVPWVDAHSEEPPCLTQIQCVQAEGKVGLLVTARSHDIFKAAIPNAFGLLALQAYIAKETGFAAGVLQITSQSAHIYEGDWENARQLADCYFWSRPGHSLQEEEFDPRGVVRVTTANGQITASFHGPDGQQLVEFKGKNADQLVRDISQQELFSQTGHALDIGVQLARAEVALKQNRPFVQDRPVNIDA